MRVVDDPHTVQCAFKGGYRGKRLKGREAGGGVTVYPKAQGENKKRFSGL